jgi:hypothetical protein
VAGCGRPSDSVVPACLWYVMSWDPCLRYVMPCDPAPDSSTAAAWNDVAHGSSTLPVALAELARALEPK